MELLLPLAKIQLYHRDDREIYFYRTLNEWFARF